MSKIKTIMFDLSEVLIRGLVGIEGEISHILNQPRDTILTKFDGNGLIKLCHGEITEDEYLSHIRQSNGINHILTCFVCSDRVNSTISYDFNPTYKEDTAK